MIAFGEQPTFSDDSRWLVYLVGFSEEQEAKLRKDKKPLQKSLGLLELATGNTTTVAGIESFSLSPRGTHVAMRRYAPEARDAGPANAPGASETIAPGTTMIVRDLASNRDLTFGSVSELAWQPDGSRLAMAMTVEGGVGNGLQLLDTADGTVRVLDSSSSTYSGLTWRKDSSALVAFRSVNNDTREGATQALLVWADLAGSPDAMQVLEPTGDGQLASTHRIVRFRAPRWAEDGSFVFIGVAPWLAKPSAMSRDGQARRLLATSDDPDEMPDVQVWHPRDSTVMPRQKIDARRDRERSMLAAFDLKDGRLVRIASALGEEATPVPRSTRVLVVDTNAFAMDRSIGRVHGNVVAIDLQTGTKTPLGDRLEDRYVQPSPAGRYALYLKSDHYWTMDLASGRATNITAAIKTSFVDRESDATVDQKPPFGVGGWSRDDQTVFLYDQHDVWEVKPDGSGATRLTAGAADQIRHRIVRLDPDAEWIDRDKPIVVSQFGVRSKKSGYARLLLGAQPSVTPLVWMDKRVDRLTKAKGPNRLAYVVQDFNDSPDYFVADDTLANATPGLEHEPVHERVRVGAFNARRDPASQPAARNLRGGVDEGQPLQGALFYPANYQPGKRYPMVVYMYEKLSDGVHQFSAPSERDYYNAAAFTTRGYFFLQPDIVFKAARARAVGRRLRGPGGAAGGGDGSRRSREGGHRRPLVGRIRQRLSGDPHRRVRRGSGRRADHRSGEQLRQPSLVQRDCRDGSHRNRPAAHASAALRRPAGLHPQFSRVSRASDEDAAADRSGRQRRHGALAPGRRAVQHRQTRRKECGAPAVRRRGSWSAQEGQPDRLPPSHLRVVRSLPDRRPGGAMDQGRRALHRSRERSAAAQASGEAHNDDAAS